MRLIITLLLFVMSPPNFPNLYLPETQSARVKRVLADKFLPYQVRWINDRARKKAWEKSRQIGATWTEAFVTTDESAKKGAKRETWWTSRDLGMAKLFILDCKGWNKTHKFIAKDNGLVAVDDSDEKAYEIVYANGIGVHSLSSNPDTQAGRRGRRGADEFGLSKFQRQLYSIMQPGLMWGGSMSFLSTHRGTNCFWNKDIVEPAKSKETNKKGFSLHTTTIELAVQEGLWIKNRAQLEKDDERYNFTDDEFLQSLRDECPDEETWLQEYMCVPADDASAFLTWEQITACGETTFERSLRVFPPDARRYVGFDIARKKDLSVITVLCDIGGVLVVEKIIIMEKTPFSEQQRRLYEVLDTMDVQRCAIDASGLGMDLAERAVTKYPSLIVPVMFTMQSKAMLAFPLRARFEDKTIRIPCGQDLQDRLYTADLRSVKKEVTSAGNIVITSEAGSTDGHADRFWSLALANHAASGPILSTVSVALHGSGRVRGLIQSAASMFGRLANRGGINCG